MALRSKSLRSDGGKAAKASVDYRLGGAHCHACRYFIEDEAHEREAVEPMTRMKMEMGRCKLVAGPIGEHMVCKLFERA